MGVPGNANALLLRTAVAADTGISRSLRFNSGDSAHLSRTPASAGNRKTWTWAGWVKRSGLGAYNPLFATGTAGTDDVLIQFNAAGPDQIHWFYRVSSSFVAQKVTTQLFRDPSAWYHLVFVWDTSNATAGDRMRLYVNGERITAFSASTDPSLNLESSVSNTVAHRIATDNPSTGYFNGYLADIYFIDGQALDPTSFGETDATTGVWNPKAYSGSYGTNGFHLEFADNSAATATTLGKDTSGNGNNFSPSNLSVTAGAGNDSLVDVPTNGAQTDTGVGGEVRGNYCTLNPLAGGSQSNGNLYQASSDVNNYGTFGVSTGKWYYEAEIAIQTGSGVGGQKIGLAKAGAAFELGSDANGWAMTVQNNVSNGKAINNGSETSSYTTFTTGDIVMCAFDVDAGKIWWGKNGTWLNSGAPASGTGAIYTNLSGTVFPAAIARNSSAFTWNFGQRQFAYTAPSGFKALCTANLPAPSVTKPSTVFDVKTYVGNGDGSDTTKSNGPTLTTSFSPDFVWIKCRNVDKSHVLHDIIRGERKRLYSNLTNSEFTYDHDKLAFNSTGIQITTNDNNYNNNNDTYVSWMWDAGSTTVTNTAGSITSSVRANATAGFSIVTYTGTGATGGSVGHGLGVAPGLIIVKNRDRSIVWVCYHSALGAGSYLFLNTTDAKANESSYWGSGVTSTVFGVQANDASGINYLNEKHVAYCFAPVSGYSSMGSYVGNGSSDGSFIYTGHRSRWIMIKATSVANESWIIIDTARSTYNVIDAFLRADTSGAEFSSSLRYVDILSNGFKLRASGAEVNGSGTTYVYASFAESPFNYARAR